jgi:diacylglycerol kinase (ATP)
MKHVAIVCNPTSVNAKSLRIADNISVLLSGMDIHHSIFIKEWPHTWENITDVWIVGGDGTLNYFINRYPGIELPLSIFSGGTGNDFHWMLYGKLKIEQQVELLLTGSANRIDAGICNKRLFLNGAGIGFDGAIVHDLWHKKKMMGKAAYFISIFKNISGYKEQICELRFKEENIKQECFMISAANSIRYGGSFKVAPKASLTDGLIDLNIIGKISLWKRLKYLPVIEKGNHLQLPFIQYRQVDKVNITSPVNLHAHLDGEYLYSDTFEIACLPKRFSFIW